MTEILKLLIEKPENLRRYVIYFLKIILSILIATRIYSYLYGSFEPILIGDENFWRDAYEFFVTGRVLIVIGVFLFSKHIILELISTVTFFILHLIPKFIRKKENSTFNGEEYVSMFKLFGVLKVEKEITKVPEPGRNFHMVMKFIKRVKKSDLHAAVFEIKNTSIFELFNLYVTFLLIYYFLLDSFNHSVINFILIIGMVLLFGILIIVEQTFKIIENDYENFAKLLRWVNQVHITEDYMKKNDLVPPDEKKLSQSWPYTGEIIFNDALIFIIHYMEEMRIGNLLKRIRSENSNAQILLITDIKLPKGVSVYLKKECIEVIRFDDEEQLTKKLDKVFFKELTYRTSITKK